MAVFGSGYPYNPYIQAYQQPMQAAPQQTSGIVWVQGEAAAKSYLVAANSTLALWDSERQTIYLKSADAAGMPTMKILDYTIRNAAPAAAPIGGETAWATKHDVDALAQRLDALTARLDSEEAGKHE